MCSRKLVDVERFVTCNRIDLPTCGRKAQGGYKMGYKLHFRKMGKKCLAQHFTHNSTSTHTVDVHGRKAAEIDLITVNPLVAVVAHAGDRW